MDLAIVWGILIGLALFIYMALDGFDLGIGMLFPFASDTKQRDHMMESIAPIWDTNETWLILASGGLYGVFPKAYSFIFNALYIPLIGMLICLIFRGVSFEFRFKSTLRFKVIWSSCFFLGSLGAAVFQGIILGQLIQGFPSMQGVFNQDYWAWWNIFNFLMGGLVALFYGFMGSNFLIYRLEHTEQHRFIRLSKILLWACTVYFFSLCISTGWILTVYSDLNIFLNGHHVKTQFTERYWLYILLGVAMIALISLLHRYLNPSLKKDYLPFIFGTLLLAITFSGVMSLGWPYIVAPIYTIWQASSHPDTQYLMLIAALIFLPIVLIYSVYNFYVFHGKITHQRFYH